MGDAVGGDKLYRQGCWLDPRDIARGAPVKEETCGALQGALHPALQKGPHGALHEVPHCKKDPKEDCKRDCMGHCKN